MNLKNRNIQVWGDSITKGIILDDNDGKYKILESNFVNRFAGITGASIINHASFGMTTGKALERIQRSITRMPPQEKTIILVEFGGNDCDFHWNQISVHPFKDHQPKTPIESFLQSLQGIIDIFHSFRSEPVLMSLPPLEPTRYFSWISRNLSAQNILLWLGDVNKIYRWQEAYNAIIAQTALHNSLPFVDVRKKFLLSAKFTETLCSDGIHPNAQGHTIILDSFLDYVQNNG
jgi:lysophospholipase L1-like esterase